MAHCPTIADRVDGQGERGRRRLDGSGRATGSARPSETGQVGPGKAVSWIAGFGGPQDRPTRAEGRPNGMITADTTAPPRRAYRLLSAYKDFRALLFSDSNLSEKRRWQGAVEDLRRRAPAPGR
ncbi:hypothetical protein GCM10010249_59470 [Streptomyces roseolilacinus]|uniref:Uncharacterized protein n=1 Tax=Streptomyces roseolilacinus TaxID=66904 RepID=A0A918EMT2_9ACTN|nr:hypothetical protein GCM10010249_59470 [Streptomyces roseolilacinus]